MKITKYPIVLLSDYKKMERSGRELRAACQSQLPSFPYSSSPNFPIHSGPTKLGNITVHPAEHLRQLEYILEMAKSINPAVDVSLIEKAFQIAWQGHAGKFRNSNKPYVEHPLEAAKETAGWGLSAEAIAAALCHDLIEDVKDVKEKEAMIKLIKEQLGEKVLFKVQGVTELGKGPEDLEKEPTEVAIYKTLLKYAAQDPDVIFIKLADRLHNMRTLEYKEEPTRKLKAQETLSVYCPIADRLGMWKLKRELEDLSFKYLAPKKYEELVIKREKIIKESKEEVGKIIATLQEKINAGMKNLFHGRLQKIIGHFMVKKLGEKGWKEVQQETQECFDNGEIRFEITPEARSIYEIHERMLKPKRNIRSPEKLSHNDIWRTNIIAEEKIHCYIINGLINEVYPPNPGEYSDNIASPRPNKHQFIHTYLKVPEFGKFLVQIRDLEMYKNFHLGILVKKEGDFLNWLNDTVQWLESKTAGNGTAKSEGIDSGAFHKKLDEVRSQIPINSFMSNTQLSLPAGSKPLDFAFKVNPENPWIFCQAKEPFVNDQLATWGTVLPPYATVFIYTDPKVKPNLNWVDHIFTDEARDCLSKNLKKQFPLKNPEKAEECRAKALKYFNKKTMKRFLDARELLKTKFFNSFLLKENFKNQNDFLYRVGVAEIRVNDFIEKFMGIYETAVKDEDRELKKYMLMVTAEDRQGFMGKIGTALSQYHMNIADVRFYTYEDKKSHKKMAEGLLVINMTAGEVEEVQQLIAKTIFRRKGADKVWLPTPEEVKEVLERSPESKMQY